MTSENIKTPRAEIDEIDIDILRLLNRRAAIAIEVGAAKSQGENPLCDAARESEVLARLVRENGGPLDTYAVENIFQRIIDESLHLQQARFHRRTGRANQVSTKASSVESGSRAAFLGEPGSFSDTAARAILGDKCVYVPFPTFEKLYQAIDLGAADLIVSPLENSLVGTIQPCYDLLARSSLKIVAEIILPVAHFLVTPPGASIDTIRSVESHPAALAQCERFFALYPHLTRIEATDTASSVRHVVESGDPKRAAIGSRRAAALYGGEVLQEHIEDHSENFTRFVLLSPKEDNSRAGTKISLIIQLKNEPGALHDALRPFVRRNIDLTKIESRPIRSDPRKFNFYLDLQAPANESDFQGAVQEIEELAEEIKYLGRYSSIRPTPEELEELV